MSRMIQVRNVSDKLHRELMRRARARGRTLTDYVEEILEREVARPPADVPDVPPLIVKRSMDRVGLSLAYHVLCDEGRDPPPWQAGHPSSALLLGRRAHSPL